MSELPTKLLNQPAVKTKLRAIIGEIAALNGGMQGLAAEISERMGTEISPQKLSHALSPDPKRVRHPINGLWLIVLAGLKGGRRLAEYMAGLSDGVVVNERPTDRTLLELRRLLSRPRCAAKRSLPVRRRSRAKASASG